MCNCSEAMTRSATVTGSATLNLSNKVLLEKVSCKVGA
jgi:hypothetical protein